jgi:hypothetical protein
MSRGYTQVIEQDDVQPWTDYGQTKLPFTSYHTPVAKWLSHLLIDNQNILETPGKRTSGPQ